MIYFTSDQHFGHNNIIKYCGRPWQFWMQMDEGLIENFNSIVTDEDTVYHLGDFCWKQDPNIWLDRLKGKYHHLIYGNHDKRSKCVNSNFDSVQEVLWLEKEQIFLSHYAHRVWPRSHHGSYHLYGHSHGGLLPWPGSMDVGVDAQGYMPISIDQVRKALDK